MKLDNISFSDEGFENFKKLTKKEQLDFVYNNLVPKDMERAEKLLKDIPHGSISSGNEQEATESDTSYTGGKPESDTQERGTTEGEKSRAKKGRKS